jgi:hypothetical protein
MPSTAITDQLTRALGEAVIRLWSDLPKDVWRKTGAGRGGHLPHAFGSRRGGLPVVVTSPIQF